MSASNKKRRLLRAIWAVAVLLVIAVSLLPASALPALDRFNDKPLHFLAYAVLAFLPALHESRRTMLLSLLTVGVLAVLLEFLQCYSVGRLFEVADMAANGWGACCGLITGALFRS